jgi:FkbM family methyltransferase
MKKIFDYWLPDSDSHFERLIKKRISQGGPAEYQDDVREAAYKYVKNFNVCVDVGANVGFWSKPLATKFKKVIAFEPLEQVYSCLEKNVEGLAVEIHKHALGSVNDSVDIVFNSSNTGSSAVNENSFGKGSIVIRTLDSLKLDHFDMIKIDCERHDLEVLIGATETLCKYKPIVVVEQHPDTEQSAGKFLETLGAKPLINVRKDFIYGW